MKVIVDKYLIKYVIEAINPQWNKVLNIISRKAAASSTLPGSFTPTNVIAPMNYKELETNTKIHLGSKGVKNVLTPKYRNV